MTETPEAVVARNMQAELDAQRDRIDHGLTDVQREALLGLVWDCLPADVRAAALAAVTR